MGIDFVWVTGLKCQHGHDLDLQSRARHDYCGYPSDAVPLEVAEDLRDNPNVCVRCYHQNYDDPALPMVGDATRYRARFVSVPRSVCPGCGTEVTCGCYQTVAIDVDMLEPLPVCMSCNGSGWGCKDKACVMGRRRSDKPLEIRTS